MGNASKVFSLPSAKYTKQGGANADTGYAYNQSSYAGGFRNDCSGFVSDALRSNGFAVPKNFTTQDIKSWAGNSNNSFFNTVSLDGGKLAATDFKPGDVLMLGSGHAGIVFNDNGTLRIADWGSSANGFRESPPALQKVLSDGSWYGQPLTK